MTPAYLLDPLHKRLEKALFDFLGTAIGSDAKLEEARSIIASSAGLKKRDEDGVMTPATDLAKGASLIISGEDRGRYRISTPIRIFGLKLMVRVNGQTDAGKEAQANRLYGALEYLLSGVNLRLALDSVTRGVRVRHVGLRAGIAHSAAGDIRAESYELDVRCVAAEMTE